MPTLVVGIIIIKIFCTTAIVTNNRKNVANAVSVVLRR